MDMKLLVEDCAARPGARRVPAILDRIVGQPALHARFVNTLSRLEYIGVRKMLKSRRSEALDLDGLQHMLDETIHALRLKKMAVALAAGAGTREAGGAGDVDTYAGAHTLAGDAGEAYIQALDGAAEAALADLPEATRAEVNYRLTSAAIEVRAQVFYPAYERCLRGHGVAQSVAAIMRDEDRHLAEMAASLEQVLGAAGLRWQDRLTPLLAVEEKLFAHFLDALERAAPPARAARPETAAAS